MTTPTKPLDVRLTDIDLPIGAVIIVVLQLVLAGALLGGVAFAVLLGLGLSVTP